MQSWCKCSQIYKNKKRPKSKCNQKKLYFRHVNKSTKCYFLLQNVSITFVICNHYFELIYIFIKYSLFGNFGWAFDPLCKGKIVTILRWNIASTPRLSWINDAQLEVSANIFFSFKEFHLMSFCVSKRGAVKNGTNENICYIIIKKYKICIFVEGIRGI